MSEHAILQNEPDFSLVLGGPLFRLFRRAHLSGGVLELPHRRILVITTVAWLPLLIMASLDGHSPPRCHTPLPERFRDPDSISDRAADPDSRRVDRSFTPAPGSSELC